MKFKEITTHDAKDGKLVSFDDFPGHAKYNFLFLWYNMDGEPHREIGPAQIWSENILEWKVNGKLHRADGPAAISPKRNTWWLHGDKYGEGNEPPDAYLEELKRRGIKYVRGSDEI